MSAYTLCRQKLESMAYIYSADVWVYLHSNFCGGLRKTHLFCNRVRIGRSGSSKVVDFGTNQKGVCDFLLAINSNFGPILHLALIGWKLRIFPPHSHLTPSFGVNPLEFLDEFFIPKTRVLGLSVVEDFDFRYPSLRRFHSIPACDGRTDGQTSRRWLVQCLYSLLCWRPVKMLMLSAHLFTECQFHFQTVGQQQWES